MTLTISTDKMEMHENVYLIFIEFFKIYSLKPCCTSTYMLKMLNTSKDQKYESNQLICHHTGSYPATICFAKCWLVGSYFCEKEFIGVKINMH